MNTLLPAAWHEELVLARWDLHSHPELRYEEFRTSDLVTQALMQYGYSVVRGLGGTGVVATLPGEDPSRGIVLRADMDALPLTEANGVAHASLTPGKMHACGHDGHTVMLLGAARLLKSLPRLPGSVHFVFQPAEEGGAGARRMIEEGLFERFPTEAVFGMHNWPGLPEGVFGLREGPIMAAGVRFHLVVRGQGAHAAQPHLARDPIPVLSALVLQMQTIVSRQISPSEPAVVSVCMLSAGETDNVIPDAAEMRGTIRSLTSEVLEDIQQRLRQLCAGAASSHGVEVDVVFHQFYPATVNTPEHTGLCTEVVQKSFGSAALQYPVPSNMTSEDFGFMLQQRPGAYVLLGNQGQQGHTAPLHNPSYDFNDAIIPKGVEFWVNLARSYYARPASEWRGVSAAPEQ